MTIIYYTSDYSRLGYLTFSASIFSAAVSFTKENEIRPELGKLKREPKLFDSRVMRVEDGEAADRREIFVATENVSQR